MLLCSSSTLLSSHTLEELVTRQLLDRHVLEDASVNTCRLSCVQLGIAVTRDAFLRTLREETTHKIIANRIRSIRG